LNPAYQREEFDFYLADLNARALIVLQNSDSPAVDAAQAQQLQILKLCTEDDLPAATDGMACSRDIALVLHTSGTTSRPKIVPLSHENICASARNIRNTLQLEPGDVCLNVMPLFHIHGLMAALMATLGAGASVCATPGFDALRFFTWFDQVQPTWYTAVPTMHQAILARAKRNLACIENSRLRFIRSASSSLSPPVLTDLEKTFGVPVVEAYAMTEATHQMTSNQLPPGKRKPGTVGCAAGPEVAIMNESSPDLLVQGQVGEVVIRGNGVTSGYENNPQANKECFVHGWFRTGDQGMFDPDNYLTIERNYQ
jgi:acyl-CoA synthetase (AMP-forming)/AMP-acid ligase II